MSANLKSWVSASLFKYFKENGFPDILPVAFHQNAPEALASGVLKRIELRVDGPKTVRRTSADDRHEFEVNILATQQITDNVYSFSYLLDLIRNGVKESYCVFKIDADHQIAPFEIVGVIKQMKSFRQPTRVHDFGLIEPNRNLQQGVVAAKFYMDYPRF
jgi:hypothetical protein